MIAGKRILLLIVAVTFVILHTGCLDITAEDPTKNTAPIIQSAYVVPSTIEPGESTILKCEATDRDGDELSCRWSSQQGSFPYGFWGYEVTWMAPAIPGVYHIKATVSDGIYKTERATAVNVYGGGGGDGNQYPAAPTCVSPANGVQGVNNWVTLSWSCSDPDGDQLTYDLYYGTTPTPPLYRYNTTATSEHLGEITTNLTYYWRVISRDIQGYETPGPVWSFTTGNGGGGGGGNRPPVTPSCVLPANGAQGVNNWVTLSWSCSDPDGDQLTYDLYYGTNPSPPLHRYNKTTTSEHLGEITINLTYYWRVVARDSQGYETPGPVWSFTTGSAGGGVDNRPPDTPTCVLPTNGAQGVNNWITLSWSCSDPDGDQLTYDLYYGTNPSPPLYRYNITSTSEYLGEITINLIYYWRVVARDSRGYEIAGPVWSFTTGSGGGGGGNRAPDTPTCTYPANGARDINNWVTLAWSCSDPDGDQLLYDIYYGTSPTPPLYRYNTNTTSEYLGEITNNLTYYWRIVAKDGYGHETQGQVWTFTTGWRGGGENSPPDAPTCVYPANGVRDINNWVTLAWSCRDPDNDQLLYDIYYGTSPTPPLYRYSTDATSEYLGEITNNLTYYWRIVAKDGSGHETPGQVWTFTTGWRGGGGNSPPDAPTCIYPANGVRDINNWVTLAWSCRDPDDDQLLYDIYYGTSPTPPLYRYNTNTTSEYLGEITNNLTYYWRIIAKDGNGHETPGQVWTFTTGWRGGGGNSPPNEPNNPSPNHAAINVDNNITISWICSDPDDDRLTYDIYFGTGINPQLYRSNVSNATVNLGAIALNTTYYWRVDAKDEHNEVTSGPLWYFTTRRQ